jgi:peptidylprolyl isomerase/FKBP-type peptidyl-prolyl cis-trans isomerase FkpA
MNGQVFDSSYDRETPFEFRVGQGDVIQAWDKGIVGLKPGAHATLYCPPQFAYGDN